MPPLSIARVVGLSRRSTLRHSPRALGHTRRCASTAPPLTREEFETLLKDNEALSKEISVLRNDMRTFDINGEIKYYSSRPQTRLDLKAVMKYCTRDNYYTASFLINELPIRIATHIRELGRLPHGLNHMPSILQLRRLLIGAFDQLRLFPSFSDHYKPSDEEQVAFTKLVVEIDQKLESTMELLARGVFEFKKEVQGIWRHTGQSTNQEVFVSAYPEVNQALDNFYLHRVGTCFLVQQHLAIANQASDDQSHVGLVKGNLNLWDAVQDAVEVSTHICRTAYEDESPPVNITGDKDIIFAHLPSHLEYILIDLLKNSMRATMERHLAAQPDTDVPPISIHLSSQPDTNEACVRVSDNGGGFPRSHLNAVWSYMFTTAKSQFNDDPDSRPDLPSSPMAGFGYGLPISRIYAQYFGGDLLLMPLEGYGVDAYLHISLSAMQNAYPVRGSMGGDSRGRLDA